MSICSAILITQLKLVDGFVEVQLLSRIISMLVIGMICIESIGFGQSQVTEDRWLKVYMSLSFRPKVTRAYFYI